MKFRKRVEEIYTEMSYKSGHRAAETVKRDIAEFLKDHTYQTMHCKTAADYAQQYEMYCAAF